MDGFFKARPARLVKHKQPNMDLFDSLQMWKQLNP